MTTVYHTKPPGLRPGFSSWIAVLSVVLATPWAVGQSGTLAEAARRYDPALARQALEAARAAYQTDATDPARQTLVEALLLVAELERINFERVSKNGGPAEEAHGAAIDQAAQEGMDLAQDLPLSSEKHRLLADLQAVMIRSKYRAKRYQKRLHEFIDQALALDQDNARAWVSHAKPLIFADADQGGDLDAGLASLEKALAINPGLESAALLKAHALDLKGDRAAAEAVWRAALERNPDCAPARDALAESGG